MTLSLTDIADLLRYVWVVCALAWIAYSWLHRVAYRRVLLGLMGLLGLDFGLHALASFAEQPDSLWTRAGIPSDFSIYSLTILLAAMAGLAAAALYLVVRGAGAPSVLSNVPTVPRLIDAALVVVVFGGIGARAYHILTRWDYYAQTPNDILNLAQGGFGLRGALVLGILALALFAALTRVSFWHLADAGAVGLCLAQSIGWAGAYLTNTYYGVSIEQGAASAAPLAAWLVGIGARFAQDLPDQYGIIAWRVPVQLLASWFYLLLFVILWVRALTRSRTPGSLFITYLVCASAAGLVFGFWRGDETLIWNSLRVDQWVDAVLLIVGVLLACARRVQAAPREVPQPA